MKRLPPTAAIAAAFLVLLTAVLAPAARSAEELRGLWVDTFHPALRNETEARQLVADARRGGFNALFVEVRKRGDAYYDSRFEPKATDVGPGFDPLQRLLGLAHDITEGPRLEVHAWIVAFNIWNQRSVPPPQVDHPYRVHPEWLTRDSAGNRWDGGNYAFDPGHPGVQQHTFNVAMDLISRYDIDGLHWDYIRYAGRQWGYNDVAVQRFNTRFNRTGKPATTDAAWLQFRRDQVSALVRKVYLTAFVLKPHLKLSAATITFAPGITTTAQWPTSAAYSDVLQDWRAWMEEGILDLNLPMVYFRQREHAESFARWNTFIKDHQYRRRAAIGLAFYLNPFAQTLQQIDLARRPSSRGSTAAGVLAYSYANPATDHTASQVLTALSQPSTLTPNPPFAIPADPVAVPWKMSPSTGHLKGFITRASDASPIDGAIVSVCGATEWNLTADATGFFGAVDLPTGGYQIRVSAPGFEPLAADVDIRGAEVAHLEFPVTSVDPANPGDVLASAGARSAVISWTSPSPTQGWIELRASSRCAPPQRVHDAAADTRHSVHLDGLEPNTSYTFTITSRAAPQEATATETADPDAVWTSETRVFRTSGSIDDDLPRPDRLPAWWAVHFLGVPSALPDEDTDGDGLSHAEEYCVGTDPTAVDSALRLDLVQRLTGGWRIIFHPRLETRTYRLQHRIDAAEPWQDLEWPHQPDGLGGGFFDADGTLAGQGQFRIQVPWPSL
jgi:uncharacterized lipoprotein YddW (UPF0748 family)